MTTTVTKTIGIAGGRDYADLQSFFNATPANLVTADQQWIGELYNDGEIVVSSAQTLAARTTDATRNIILRTATGAGVADNANKLTNALYYNAANGVAIRCTVGSGAVITIPADYTEIRGLQIKSSNSNSLTLLTVNGHNVVIVGNVLECASDGGSTYVINAGNSAGGDAPIIENNTCVRTSSAGVGRGITTNYNNAGSIVGNTLYTATASTGQGIQCNTTGPVIKNNAIFGFNTTAIQGGNVNTTNNSTSAASISSGSGNLVSQVFANQFVSTTDLRIKAGAGLIAAGVAFAGWITDILGQTRASPPSIGAQEYVSPPAALVASPTVVTTATASLTTQILLAASGTAVATATGVLSSNGFAGTASVVATMTASLTTAIRLLASAVGLSSATAALTTSAAVGFDFVLGNNTGQLWTGETGLVVNIYNATTGVLVLRKTGLTSHATTANVQVRDITGVIVAGTTYSYEPVLTLNGRVLPTAQAV